MSRLSTSGAMGAAHNELHQAADQFVAASSDPTHLERHRDKFLERALRDVTTNSNDYAMMLDPTNPLLVGDEMEAQKDYFRKLKFTYLEQEAKKNFLIYITGDNPGPLDLDNEKLEDENKAMKAKLKASKDENEAMKSESIKLARSNAEQHAEISKQTAEVIAVRKQIRDMELELARIKAAHPPEDRMTTDQANQILDNQTVDLERLTEELSTTAQRTEDLRAKVAREAKTVLRLARDREREEARAAEARRGREGGSTKVHDMCRWYAASLATYRSLLGIRGAKAVSDSELELEYEVGSSLVRKAKSQPTRVITLRLTFGAEKKLFDAKLGGSDIDIHEAIVAAVDNNDVPGLIADVLVRIRAQD